MQNIIPCPVDGAGAYAELSCALLELLRAHLAAVRAHIAYQLACLNQLAGLVLGLAAFLAQYIVESLINVASFPGQRGASIDFRDPERQAGYSRAEVGFAEQH